MMWRKVSNRRLTLYLALICVQVLITFFLMIQHWLISTKVFSEHISKEGPRVTRAPIVDEYIVDGHFENASQTNVFDRAMYLHELPQYTRYTGQIPTQKKFLTIGISTISRKGGVGIQYIKNTVECLAMRTNNTDKKDITIMIFLAGSDVVYNNMVKQFIASDLYHHFETGFIGILEISKDAYPPLEGLKRNFKDSDERVTWRAKQVVDFAYMFFYARNFSKYYLHLEDDVITSQGYVQAIRDYIAQKYHQVWMLLEFCELGFIGKLFRTSDLERLAGFMLTFYDEQPVDFLYKYFIELYTQKKRFIRKPTLFQHFGLRSSLSEKKGRLEKGVYFDRNIKPVNYTSHYPKSDHPNAKVYTSFTTYTTFDKNFAYHGSSFLWTEFCNAGSTIQLIFQTPQYLSRVIVQTGHEGHILDYLRHGTLSVSPTVDDRRSYRGEDFHICERLEEVDTFVDGLIDAKNLEKTIFFPVKCLEIEITQSQIEWLIVRPILVYLQNTIS